MCVSEFQNDDRYCPGLLLGVKETHRGNVNAPVCVSEFVPPPIDKKSRGFKSQARIDKRPHRGRKPANFFKVCARAP